MFSLIWISPCGFPQSRLAHTAYISSDRHMSTSVLVGMYCFTSALIAVCCFTSLSERVVLPPRGAGCLSRCTAHALSTASGPALHTNALLCQRPPEAVGCHSELPLLVLWRMHLLGQYLCSRLNWPQDGYFRLESLPARSPPPFSSLPWSSQGGHQGFPDQSPVRRARRPGKEGGMILSQGDHFGTPPSPSTHTHTLTGGVSGSSRRNWQFHPLSM